MDSHARRRLLTRTLVVGVALAMGCVLWAGAGRLLSLSLERVCLRRVSAVAMTSIGFAKGKREWMIFPGGDYLMSARRYAGYGQDLEPLAFDCAITPDGRVVMSHAGRSIDLGPLGDPPKETEFGMTYYATKEPGDTASFTEEHGLILWPAWFTWPTWLQYQGLAHLPLWFRHKYHRIVWEKHSGERLEMLWRRKQTGFASGWADAGPPTPEPDGLIHVAISPGSSRYK